MPRKKIKPKKKTVKKKTVNGKNNTEALLESLLAKEETIKHAEEALLESIRRLRDIFEQSPTGIALYDKKGELLLVNSSYLRIFGLKFFSEIQHQDLFSIPGLAKNRVGRLGMGEVIQHEVEYDFDKGDFPTEREGTGNILYTISPLFRENKVIGYMAQAQDITERKKIAESQRLAQLGRLLSDMAHEINNPLMVISGNAELAIMEGVRNPKTQEVLKIILDQCFFAQDVIQRLLKYSRLGTISKSSVNVRKTIDLITGILQRHFESANIRFKIDVKKDTPPVMANDKQLQEVFMNIIRNSADAMPDGGVITIRAGRDKKNNLKLEVKDTGEGMPENVRLRVFEPFFTTKQKGTGLGLAVCHTIIHEHGGTLKYDSMPGKGTTATIILPAAS